MMVLTNLRPIPDGDFHRLKKHVNRKVWKNIGDWKRVCRSQRHEYRAALRQFRHRRA